MTYQQVPVRVHWSYAGKSGSWETEAPSFDPGVLHSFWWTDSNGSCDCNKVAHCGLMPADHPELNHMPGEMYGDGSGPVEGEPHERCGNKITLTRIESLDPAFPSLEADDLKAQFG